RRPRVLCPRSRSLAIVSTYCYCREHRAERDSSRETRAARLRQGCAPSSPGSPSTEGADMATNVQKTLTDAGYIAVGLGVMTFQQAQARVRAARGRVSEVGGCLAGRARDARNTLDTQTQTARAQAETQVRNTVARAGAIRDEV